MIRDNGKKLPVKVWDPSADMISDHPMIQDPQSSDQPEGENMADEILVLLRDAATRAKATTPQVKYWVKLLGVSPMIRARMAYLTTADAGRVETMARLIGGGASPREAAATLAPRVPETVSPIYTPQIPARSNDPMISSRLDGIERSIMVLVETYGREAAAIRATVERQAEEIRALRTALLPAPQAPDQPICQVIPWSPEPRPDPADGMPWWRVAWLSIVAPERLRRFNS